MLLEQRTEPSSSQSNHLKVIGQGADNLERLAPN
jgi:hypothetical protein